MMAHPDDDGHGSGMTVRAPAKVNLFLEVTGRRPDGYHDLETLMVSVDLYDELRMERTDDDRVYLTCDRAELSTGPDNLVVKAAELLRQECGRRDGVRMRLTKRIPWAAGLGGGSSDAAAALRGLNEIWRLGLNRRELSELGARLGSDVPVFMNDTGAAWCTGRGELVEPMADPPILDFVLVMPDRGLSTREIFGRLRLPNEPRSADDMRQAFASGDVGRIGACLHNRLQEPAFQASPETAETAERLRSLGTVGVLMSGSGSCLFALCRHSEEARQVQEELSSGSASSGFTLTRRFVVRSCSCI